MSLPFGPYTNICTYRVKAGCRAQFLELLKRHWPALRAAGFATETPAVVYETAPWATGKESKRDEGATTFVEIFSWTRPDGPALAHDTPEVMAVWEPMGVMVEERDGRPAMEFPAYAPVSLD